MRGGCWWVKVSRRTVYSRNKLLAPLHCAPNTCKPSQSSLRRTAAFFVLAQISLLHSRNCYLGKSSIVPFLLIEIHFSQVISIKVSTPRSTTHEKREGRDTKGQDVDAEA